MKTWRIARNWWLQWTPKSFAIGVTREWGDTTFFLLPLITFAYCPKCGAKDTTYYWRKYGR